MVFTDTIATPMPPARLRADWERDIADQLALEPGDVEALSLARARRRWPDYQQCVEAVLQWAGRWQIAQALASSTPSLMVCRGARYHHDGDQYGDKVFCNLFLSEDKGLDLHYPATGTRIPLVRGTVVIFDTCQPHGVIDRAHQGFHPNDFAPPRDCSQVFLTWELPLDDASVRRLLNIDFGVNPSCATAPDQAQIWRGGARANVCPESGRWL
jgi:hypothetical protein